MDRIKKIKIKQQDGIMSDYYPIGADASNIDLNYNGSNVETTLRKKPYYYDNIAAMKADDTLKEGDMVTTLGFYSKNDGGKAQYKIRTKTNDDIIDNMTILQMNNVNLIAELIINDFINIDSLGAVGDGITDDTNIVLKSISLAQEKNKTLIASKNYLLSQQIDMSNINCDLKNATFKTIYGVKILNTQKKVYTLPTITAQNESENSGLIIENCNDCVFNITQIGNFKYGLHLKGDSDTGIGGLGGSCCYNKIYTQLITLCQESMFLENLHSGYVNENVFVGGHLFNTSAYLSEHANVKKLHLKGNGAGACASNLFLKVCFEGPDNDTSYKVYLEKTDNIMFLHCRFEGINPNPPKFYCGNDSYRTQIIGGYFLNLEYPNKKPDIILGQNNQYISGTGIIDNPTLTLINTYGFSQSTVDIINPNNNRRTTKIYPSKVEVINPVADNEYKYSLSHNGIVFTDKDGNSHNALMSDAKNTFVHTPDFQHAFIIGHSSSYFTAGIHLWEFGGHLYGKYGAPTSETDGTMLL